MAQTFISLLFLTCIFSAVMGCDARFSPRFHRSYAKHAVHRVRAPPVIPTSLIGNWSSKGCYTDAVDSRSLSESTYLDATGMTIESCILFCSNADFAYAGTEYSQECFCSNSIANSSATKPSSECSMACSGNATESCGGPNRLNVFWSGRPDASGPVTPAKVGLWSSLGCYNDSAAARTLPIGMGTTGKVSVESCTSACQVAGYNLAGMEYSQECYCADSFSNGGAPVSDGCTLTCAGNSSQFCGGPNRLNVYAFNGSFTAPTTKTSSAPTSAASTSPSPSETSPTGSATSTTSTTQPTGSGWSSLGCYTDDVANRSLATRLGTNGAVTTESCTAVCQAAGFVLAGTEYSTECYCANEIGGAGQPSSSGCTMKCEGNDNQFCGGANRLNLYTFNNAVSPPTTTTTIATSGPSGWTTLGCYNDSTTARVLQHGPMPINGALTVQKCEAACEAGNFVLAGVEYAAECYCDNAFRSGGAPANDGCTMPCAGDETQMCGGSYRLNVFQFGAVSSTSTTTTLTNSPDSTSSTDPGSGTSGSSGEHGTSTTSTEPPTTTSDSGTTSTTSHDDSSSSSTTSTSESGSATSTGWKALGCYTDNVAQRTFRFPIGVNGANSVEACTSACYNAGYGFAGLEYSTECHCDGAVQNGATIAPDGDAQCDMPCSGNASQVCGGPDRLNVYSFEGTVPISSGNGDNNGGNNGGNGGNGNTGSAVGPVLSGLPDSWTYKGCYIDGANGRIVPVQQPDNQALTVQNCVSTCSGLGYSIAAMEYMYQCFCGNQVVNGGALASADSDCAMGCSGNASQACGGPNRMSIYSSSANLTVVPVATSQTTNLPGHWEYKGCLAESEVPGSPRMLPYKSVKDNNSATTCLSQCSKFGYAAAGMEWGVECYCGDVSDIAKAGASNVSDAECNMPCSGDPAYLCGAGNRLSYYEWVGEPLLTWHTPENKGEYQFLIGGPVIPLITTLGTNNKVTFVEKHGTGVPNTTGAYELDLSAVNNYDLAWRTMTVKTDVFCAAGVVLPDKVGRQLNVGGWSAESLFGVRLYWPDGSAGVPGTNDWQENVNELKLQRGRWYPTAMTMANGSILVVGGEDGSNGAPEPTLEVLPAPAGGPTWLEMDWLKRTDPFNLYPYLYVLPGGGIFAISHNEALIMDETSFATVKGLSNLPGAVNDDDGGRCYPLEGTSVMHPQHAPYTDPVTVMACGGSTKGPGVALDNCVSIQPEVEGAEWVIERMPSKRVMSCMAALPDGTFLILNGAHQGHAGFRLSSDPNLEAVLYDPSQPVGSRYSKLASTTIARMYHSEATLLQDGRVLVSGSDPQDAAFPQEYRVEVFVPPYLLSGKTQPELHIQNTDWAYGSTIEFTAKLFNGGASDVKVSLLAAVSSTHGNSMNQRILFPEVHCSGSSNVSCTVTAPPNAHVCPPGWFQLFVLDGPTPSRSTWVRIGGDPASLGDWPPYEDFSRPGM